MKALVFPCFFFGLKVEKRPKAGTPGHLEVKTRYILDTSGKTQSSSGDERASNFGNLFTSSPKPSISARTTTHLSTCVCDDGSAGGRC